MDLLLAQDCSDALVPLEIRKGRRGEPFATRTLLGWSLNGSAALYRPNSTAISHFISASKLEAKIDQLWNIDNDYCSAKSLSPDDQRVIDLWDSQCKLINGLYQLPIPWKDATSIMPNNLQNATSRLLSIEKSLMKRNTFLNSMMMI